MNWLGEALGKLFVMAFGLIALIVMTMYPIMWVIVHLWWIILPAFVLISTVAVLKETAHKARVAESHGDRYSDAWKIRSLKPRLSEADARQVEIIANGVTNGGYTREQFAAMYSKYLQIAEPLNGKVR